MSGQFLDEQSLRLLRAFFEVPDQEARERIIVLAEEAARTRNDGTYTIFKVTSSKR